MDPVKLGVVSQKHQGDPQPLAHLLLGQGKKRDGLGIRDQSRPFVGDGEPAVGRPGHLVVCPPGAHHRGQHQRVGKVARPGLQVPGELQLVQGHHDPRPLGRLRKACQGDKKRYQNQRLPHHSTHLRGEIQRGPPSGFTGRAGVFFAHNRALWNPRATPRLPLPW